MNKSIVRLVEVSPRDGLQNVSKILKPEDRATFIKLLSNAGLEFIEGGSFVSPKWVPSVYIFL